MICQSVSSAFSRSQSVQFWSSSSGVDRLVGFFFVKYLHNSASDPCGWSQGLSLSLWRAKLVVLACEVGGWWSTETQAFLRQFAKAKARTEPVPQHTRARAASFRWMTIMATARAFSQSLLEARGGEGCDGTPSTAEVVGEYRFLCVWFEPSRVVRSRVTLFHAPNLWRKCRLFYFVDILAQVVYFAP